MLLDRSWVYGSSSVSLPNADSGMVWRHGLAAWPAGRPGAEDGSVDKLPCAAAKRVAAAPWASIANTVGGIHQRRGYLLASVAVCADTSGGEGLVRLGTNGRS